MYAGETLNGETLKGKQKQKGYKALFFKEYRKDRRFCVLQNIIKWYDENLLTMMSNNRKKRKRD